MLDNGEGDYLIFTVVPQGDPNLPAGSLLPIIVGDKARPPQFIDAAAAKKWIRNESGQLLVGKQVMIVCIKDIMNISLHEKPTIVISEKPKVPIQRPDEEKRP